MLSYLLEEWNTDGDESSLEVLWFEKIEPLLELKHKSTRVGVFAAQHFFLEADFHHDSLPLGLDSLVRLRQSA